LLEPQCGVAAAAAAHEGEVGARGQNVDDAHGGA
jgi:hypothetical protein